MHRMQQPSPALSSPSTGFFGPRASPLFTQSVDQPDPPFPSSDFARPLPIDSSSSSEHGQAPPKQLAQAMEGLGHAIRLIAEVRLCADIVLEALDRATAQRQQEPVSNKKAGDWILQAGEIMGASLEALRTTGRKLEASGVLNGALQRFEEKQPWGLQVPLICPDGAIVAYSWKRQIAGQAAASAVDRTRLALKAFTEQRRRFFPCLGDSSEDGGNAVVSVPDKRLRISNGTEGNVLEQGKVDECSQGASLLDFIQSWQTEAPGMIITTFTRLDWAKQKSSIAGHKNTETIGSGGSGLPRSASALKLGADPSSMEKVSILEVTIPAVFKAIVSLFPSGTLCPDAVSVFAVDEVRGYTHVGSASSHAVFQRISECATSALHNFLLIGRSSALNLLLHWLYTYRSLFSKPCSQCKRILALDRPSDLLLPPVVRPLRQVFRLSPSVISVKVEDLNDEKILAFHLACAPKEESMTG